MGGGGLGFPFTMPGLPIVGSAGFEDDDDMKAAFAARKGWRAVVRWTVHCSQSTVLLRLHSPVPSMTVHVPRSANAVARRVVENIPATRRGDVNGIGVERGVVRRGEGVLKQRQATRSHR
jgi:hypothetical protein